MASASTSDVMQPRSSDPRFKGEVPKLTAKHKIFLSHSGAQKEFVRGLCLDLERLNHFPFFDQSSDSLPKGEKFPPLIFEAARQCLLAVVVLSVNFLTSKWPMIELCEFVKAQKRDNPKLRLLPLFFEVSPADISNEAVKNRWTKEWTKFFSEAELSAGLQECSESLSVLRATNGLDFHQYEGSAVAFKEAIIEEICTMLPPPELFEISEIVGGNRLCKIVASLWEKNEAMEDVPEGLCGLYGSAGEGKTTLCKSLCNHFQVEYLGRVCHVELGKNDRLASQKKVLRRLTRTPLNTISRLEDADEAQQILVERIHMQPVFLVVDNIQDDEASCEEARAYLRVPYRRGSKLLFTARSLGILEKVFGDRSLCESFCHPLPKLDIMEAASILLRKAAPTRELASFTTKEREVILSCVDSFGRFPRTAVVTNTDKGSKQITDNIDTDPAAALRRYHPLALRALGVFLYDVAEGDVLCWKTELYHHYHDMFKLSPEAPSMFLILGLGFKRLSLLTKILFLDLALFAPVDYFKNLEGRVLWLASIHAESTSTIRLKLKELRRKAYLEDWKDGMSILSMHDLYKEYAAWYVNEARDPQIRCLFEQFVTSCTTLFQNKLPGEAWSSVIRLCLPNSRLGRVPRVHTQKLTNVVVLQLYRSLTLSAIDVRELCCLRHLEVSHCYYLRTLCGFEVGDLEDPDEACRAATKECCLPDLQFLILYCNPKLKCIPNLGQNSSLQQLIAPGCPDLQEVSWFLSLSSLTTLICCCSFPFQAHHLGLSLGLQNFTVEGPGEFDCFCSPDLQTLLTNSSWAVDLGNIGCFTNLTTLALISLPLAGLQGLESLTRLTTLSLRNCLQLASLPCMEELVNLNSLDLSFTAIEEARGIDKMLMLQSLSVMGCRNLQCLPNLHRLSDLQNFDISGCTNLRLNFRLPRHTLIRYVTNILSPWVTSLIALVEYTNGWVARVLLGQRDNTTLKYELDLEGRMKLNCKYFSTLIEVDSTHIPEPNSEHEETMQQANDRCRMTRACEDLLKSVLYGAPCLMSDSSASVDLDRTFPLNDEEFDDLSLGWSAGIQFSNTDSGYDEGMQNKAEAAEAMTSVGDSMLDDEPIAEYGVPLKVREFLAEANKRLLALDERRRAMYASLADEVDVTPDVERFNSPANAFQDRSTQMRR